MFAVLLRLGSALLLASLLMIVKLASQSGIALPEIMFWRQFGSIPLLLGWLAITGRLAEIRTSRIRAHAGRSTVGTINMVFNFESAIRLPLAVQTTLGFTTPLHAVLIAAVYFRETVGIWRWSAVLLGFAGVLVVARPGAAAIDSLGATLALTCAFLIAVINYQIRDLGKTETPVCIVFWFAVFGSLLIAPTLPFFMTRHDPFQWMLLAGLGIAGTLGQVLLAASLRYAKVSNIIAIDYTSLIWATGYGWLIWDTLPHAGTFIGAPLIIAAGIIIAWRQHRLARDVALSTAAAD